MLVRSGILSLLIIVNTISQKFVNAELEHESFETFFKNGHFIKDVDSLTSPGQVYGSCRDKGVHDSVLTVECSLIMETRNNIDSSEPLDQCNFTLFTKVNSEYKVYRIQSLVGIDKNKAVLTLKSFDHTKLFVLHFSGCEAVPVERDFKTKNVKIYAPFDDVFDIFISDDDELCQPGHLCKLTVDTRRNVVSDVENWPGKFEGISTVAHSPSKGRIMVDVHKMIYFNRTVARVYTAKNDNVYNVLYEHEVDNDQEKIVTSITQKFVSVCSAQKANVTCVQFDLDGKLKFKKTMNISDEKEIEHFNIHNLPKGGLLLLTQGCDKQDPESCNDGGSFDLKNLNAVGEAIGRIVIHEFGKVNVEDLHFFESKDKKMCLSHTQRNWIGIDRVKLDVVCFTNEDFFAEVVEIA